MKKLLKVPVYFVFDDEGEDKDDETPFPGVAATIAYLLDAFIIDLDTEGCGQCEGAACGSVTISWDEAVVEEQRESDEMEHSTGGAPDKGQGGA